MDRNVPAANAGTAPLAIHVASADRNQPTSAQAPFFQLVFDLQQDAQLVERRGCEPLGQIEADRLARSQVAHGDAPARLRVANDVADDLGQAVQARQGERWRRIAHTSASAEGGGRSSSASMASP